MIFLGFNGGSEFFWGGGLFKGDCLKRGGAWQERGGGVFEGVDTLMPTMLGLIKDVHGMINLLYYEHWTD